VPSLASAGAASIAATSARFKAWRQSWSVGDWDKEFRSWSEIASKVGPNNALADVKLDFSPKDVIGFRAPYLAKGAGLYGALRSNGFRYDTSGTGHADAWPEKIDGIWRFNLAMLKVRGRGRNTLSMDYNLFMAQLRAKADPRRVEAAREQTLQTYLAYFKTNYTGNRAPLHIGHHFEPLQHNAYNEALKSFARAVCGLPEVRCGTYAKLADVMDGQISETLTAYRKGDFARAAPGAQRGGSQMANAAITPRLPPASQPSIALAREAPVIAGEVAVLAERAVTGTTNEIGSCRPRRPPRVRPSVRGFSSRCRNR
jgi:hypothetical protein